MKNYCINMFSDSICPLECCVVACGSDLSVTICGGSRSHVGAVALGTPISLNAEKSMHSATVSVLCAYEHRDDEVARWAARYLATNLNCNVTVTVGIHIDNATKTEIDEIMNNSRELCEKIFEIEEQAEV